MKITEILFILLRNAAFGEEICEEVKSAVTEHSDELYKLSKHHDVSHLVSYAIEKNGILLPQTDLSKKFKKRHPIAVIRYESLAGVFRKLCEVFEEEKIPFIPLKGTVVRNLYPEPWMRTSCDIDILVKKGDLEKVSCILTDKLGFEKRTSGTHDVSFFSPDGIHVELHFGLTEIYYENPATQLLEEVWDYAVLKDGTRYWYVLSDEFFYMYHIYHMAKHFEVGGCGIRPFLDLWMLDNKIEYDIEKRKRLLEKSELLAFANACRVLSDYWFSDGEKNDMILKMQEYILGGGVYGTASNRHSVMQVKTENRFRHILGRIFLSYDKLKIKYPIIERHKWLIPFYQMKRWFKLINPKYRAIAKDNLQSVSKPSEAKAKEMTEFLEYIGLKK